MNEYLLCFWITAIGAVAIGVGYALLKKFLQNRDFKRQLEGKEPFREWKKDSIPEKKEEKLNHDFEIEKDRMRSQNLPPI